MFLDELWQQMQRRKQRRTKSKSNSDHRRPNRQLARPGRLTSGFRPVCSLQDSSVRLLKLADDTTVIFLIYNDDGWDRCRVEEEQLAVFCNLELNALRSGGDLSSTDLNRDAHTDTAVEKAQQRLFFLLPAVASEHQSIQEKFTSWTIKTASQLSP